MSELTPYQKAWNAVNDFLHLPIIEWVSYYLFWGTQLLLAPLYLPFLLLLAIYDIACGYMWWTEEEPKGRVVLVTGCDTGFGHDLALNLSGKGWKVYAGCLTDNGLKAITEKDASGSLIAVKLDVTSAEDIKEVVDRVDRENPQGLFALVNNAGVGRGAVVDWASMQDFRFHMEVNFFSVVAMVKSSLPLMKRCQGARVVIVSSMAGIIPGMPCMAAYCASKHAVESFSGSLRTELRGWGIKVVGVNPSFHRTAIANNAVGTLQATFERLSAATKEEYGERYLRVCKQLTKTFTNGSWDPKNVEHVLVHATVGVSPRPRYLVGSDAKSVHILLTYLPVRVLDFLIKRLHARHMIPAAVWRKAKAEEEAAKAGEKEKAQ